MDKMFQNKSGEQSEHPPREMLLLFVDGELPVKEAAQLEMHLEACWPCRVKTKKIQEAIANIIEFDEQVLTPRLLPPQGWRNFDRKLTQLVAVSGKQSLSSRLFGSLGRFLPSSHLFGLPRLLLRPIVRNAAAVLVVVLIVAFVIRFKHEPTVSASELLKNAIEAQTRQVHALDEAVIHQKLQVRRKDQALAREESVNWEIWNDTKNSRVRQFLAEGNLVIPLATDTTLTTDHKRETMGDVINELAHVLEANHMDPLRPLSAASYQSWHNTLQHQQDKVIGTKLPGGLNALKLRTVPAAPLNIGQIVEAEFVVRASDWQPVELRMDVAAEGGNRIYELTESSSEVVSLAQVNPANFADQPIVSPTPAASPKELKKQTPTPALAPNPQPLSFALAATADLEVEALRLLNRVGADLGEQISVNRPGDGMLHIGGIVETDRRKSEIINALDPIARSPAVRIEIQTVAEAVAKQTTTKAAPSPSVRQVEITGNTLASEPELYAYFAGKTKDKESDTNETIRLYATRMVSLSGQAMDHLWAMKRLVNQFPAEQMHSLAPEARVKWISLIRAHARSYQQKTDVLRHELHPVFFPGQSLATAISSEETVIRDTNDLSHAVEQLFELGASNDRVIRSAFTSSTGGVMTTVIKAPQFWQSLKNAEGLAARIANSY